MLAHQLNKAWEDCRRSTTVNATMRFTDEGLILGAGTILAPSGGAERDISIDPSDPKLRALLSAAHLRLPTDASLAHLRKAAERWSEGVDALATMHLALSGLDRLQRPDVDAHRLFLAAALLREGVEAKTIVAALGADVLRAQHFSRLYNPQQPRVPPGNGMQSGRWTSGEGPPGGPQASAEPRSVARETQPYSGPDACYRAKVDCWRNIALPTYRHGNANDNWSKWHKDQAERCSLAEIVCETVGFVVEKTPIIRRGAVIYPDGGVVVSQKGWVDYLYFPAPARGKIPPFRRSR